MHQEHLIFIKKYEDLKFLFEDTLADMKNTEKIYTDSVVKKYFERESLFDDFNFCQNLKNDHDKLDFKKCEDPGGTG